MQPVAVPVALIKSGGNLITPSVTIQNIQNKTSFSKLILSDTLKNLQSISFVTKNKQ